MKLRHGLHLAYCTNIHRGETWPETFATLKTHTLAVREKVCPQAPFAIGLRLSKHSVASLTDRTTRLEFLRWLEKHDCYVFTINGFPYGQFHGGRVKEQVYRPDWTTPERLAYTNQLFDLLVELLPPGVPGSVSTLPGSFKEFAVTPAGGKLIRDQLHQCAAHIAQITARTGRELHLGLEPEPLCLLENTVETLRFFEQLRAEHPGDERLARHLGVNYDTCHFAVEFEQAAAGLDAFAAQGIRISKLHLSSALKVRPTLAARATLEKFSDEVYLHQVIAHCAGGSLKRFRDLPEALAAGDPVDDEWRVHFHVPLHAPATPPFQNTNDHLLATLDWLAKQPERCAHLEMETYTWEVLPPELKSQTVEDQLAAEYRWTLGELQKRRLA